MHPESCFSLDQALCRLYRVNDLAKHYQKIDLKVMTS